MNVLGWVHTAFGVLALGLGAGVLLRPKGTRRHRRLGWGYVAAMLGLLATAFLIYDVFGRFGPFHWLAVVSLLTLSGGVAAARLRRRFAGWTSSHYFLMAYSYVGLLAATAAEIAVRLPGVDFATAATVASVGVTALGAAVVHRKAERAIGAVRRGEWRAGVPAGG